MFNIHIPIAHIQTDHLKEYTGHLFLDVSQVDFH